MATQRGKRRSRPQSPYIRTAELAFVLGVHDATVHKHLKDGTLTTEFGVTNPPIKVGRQYRFSRAGLEADGFDLSALTALQERSNREQAAS